MRGLSQEFLDSLKGGLLQPVLTRVKKDDTLMLAIRDGYINIYYRGGNLLKITKKPGILESYDFHFDKNYDLTMGNISHNALQLPVIIINSIEVEKWISSISLLKEIMDFWFMEHPKLEREFQQLVERENNRSSISNETEYFITDIEMTDANIGARFDILAIKWLATGRRDGKNCKASFIEMKYGDVALGGISGIVKHIEDINKFLSDKINYSKILIAMTQQFNQLNELGLINFKQCTNNTKVKINPVEKPEFIFLLANHNPRSLKLKRILKSADFIKFIDPDLFDLRFFVSSDAGYGMHNYNMLTYDKYLSRLSVNVLPAPILTVVNGSIPVN